MPRALVILVILAGCGDKELARLEEIRDEVCACKTPACGKAAMDKIPAREIKSTPRSQKIAQAMFECFADLQAQDRPSTDPDAEAPEDPERATGAPAETP